MSKDIYHPMFRLEPLSKEEREFWKRFPDLSIDDPEDNLNEIISILRNEAIHYFRKKKYIYKGKYNWQKVRKALLSGISKDTIRKNNLCLELRKPLTKGRIIYK